MNPAAAIAFVLAFAFRTTACHETTGSDLKFAVNQFGEGPTIVGRGIACSSHGRVGPPSYPVNLVGKPGVPHLRAADLVMLQRMLTHIHPKWLRFVYLDNRFEHHHIVIFNAPPSKLCDPASPPFISLTGACNEYYEPLYVMSYTTPGPQGCVNPPRPWIPGDAGKGRGSWAAQLGQDCGDPRTPERRRDFYEQRKGDRRA